MYMCYRGPAAPPLQGNMPSQRLRSEIHANPVPPPCVQNAMLTKDKKPFTYTPGGIDLSEIRSPRMAKRIERNAQAPGVGEQPKSPNTYHPSGPLPPSALAAMQTNMPVQVFPSGAPPPPPPPPSTQQQAPGRSIPPPPPPPPPQGPLPTKPVSTNEGVFDRPDMTRIIPDNPMAMLRKTPKIERMNFLDELNDLERQQNRPPPQQYQQSAPIKQNIVASPQYQNQAPLTPQLVPQTPQYSPPVQKYQVQSSPVVPYVNSGPSSADQHRSQVGVLYIPPVTTSNGNNNPNEVSSPPTPPIRNPQSPQSPQVQLNKAPRPWQNQKRDEEKPTWAHKAEIVSPPQDEYIAPPYQPPQQQQPEPPRRQQSYQQPEYYPHPQMAMYPGQGDPNAILNEAPAPRAGVDVVWVTQPQVMVHPGVAQQQQQRSPQPQQQQQTWQQNPPKQQPVDGQGARIIQVEREQPPTPERNFNRQPSWGPPTQSNSFKVLQKMTSTDGELDDDNSPATEHPPKTSQEFNQTPADQIRKMKMSQDDRELVHKFKQDSMIEYYYLSHYEDEDPRHIGDHAPSRVFWILDDSDDDSYLHHEVDPRYRGPAIPSKAFRLLQSMTDSFPEDYPPCPNVPKGQQQSAPYVRNIPIQIEGDDSAGPYVHPSQQSVPEPKKYTGGNIPGRSFKMLQSMTGQTSPLATNSEYYETNQPYSPYNMLYPPPSPYLPYYWPNYYYPNQPDVNSDNKTTPEASRSTTPSVCSSCRNTPVPFWNYYYPMPYYPNPETDEESKSLDYQRMCDPFYYPYYYYYLPVQTAHLAKNYKRRSYTNSEELSSHCDTQQAQKDIKRRSYADAEDWSSSNDEIAYYNQEAKGVQREMLAGRVLKATTAGVTSSNCEDDGKSYDKIDEALEAEDGDSTDSEEDNAQCKVVRDQRSGGLQSIKSVKDMNALNNEESEDNISEVETLIDEEGDNYITANATSKEYDVEGALISLIEVEDTMPNILSVIFVESACSYRTSSVFTDVSDDTVVIEDEDSICEVVSAKLPLKLTFTVNCDNEDVTEIAVGNHEVEAVPLILDIEATFTISEENSKIEERENSSDSSEIDFWSEIITEEEVVPKPNRLEVYRNALRDVEVVTNETIEKTDEESTVCVNKHRNSSYDAVDLKENQNSSQAVHIGNSESAISSFEFNKKKSSKLDDDTKKLKKRAIDKASRTCETFNKTSSVEKTEDAIVVVGVEDYKLSNLVFERPEDLEISTAPSLELDLSVEEICSKRNGSKKGELEVEDKSNEENKAPRIENTLKNYGDQDHVEINSEELKTNDTSDTVKSPCEETHRTSTVEDLQIDQAAVPCCTNSSNSSSLSRSSSTSGKEYVKDYSEGEESEGDESGPEDDHETPVVKLDSQDEARTTPKNDRNNNEEVAFGVPSIKVRIKSLQEASCGETKKIIATMEVPKGTNKLPNIVQATENKSIDNSEDEGDSGVTSDMSRHISDSESEFSELRKMSRYQRAATHSRLYQLLHSSCSEEELRQEETKTCEENMMKRREHLTLPLKKSVDSESSSGLNSPSSPLTDKLAYELVLSLLRKKKGQIFRNMPMEKLHAAALMILQEDKDCTDLSSSEDFHNCLSPLRTDTQYSTPAQTPAEFYANSTYSDYYATWQNYDEEPHFVVPHKKKVTPECTPKCPRVPIVPKPVSKVPPDHVPS